MIYFLHFPYKADDKNEQVASPSVTSTTNEEECLIAAWTTVSRGTEDSLTRDELVRVFQCVGLESGSEEVSLCAFKFKIEVRNEQSEEVFFFNFLGCSKSF